MLDAYATAAHPQEDREGRRSFAPLPARPERGDRASDEPLRQIDPHHRFGMMRREAQGLPAREKRPEQPRRTHGLEPHVEATAGRHPLPERLLGAEHLGELAYDLVEPHVLVRLVPGLVEAHDHHLGPPQTIVLTQLANEVEAVSLDLQFVYQEDVRIEVGRPRQTTSGRVDDDDGRTEGAKLLGHRVGARRVIVGQQDAQTRHVRGGAAVLVGAFEVESHRFGRMRVELVAHQLGCLHQRLDARDEVRDEVGKPLTLAEHEPYLRPRAVVAADGQDPAAKLAAEHAHEIVERRLANLADVCAARVRHLFYELDDAPRDRVDTCGPGHDGRGAEPERVDAVGEVLRVGEDDDRDHGGEGRRREGPERPGASVPCCVTDQEDCVGCDGDCGLRTVVHAGVLHR